MSKTIQGWIYKITNTVNGKVYVGQTTEKKVETRWNRHRRELIKRTHLNSHLQSAWNKYGECSFDFEVIEKFDSSTNFDLNNLERYWIKHFDSMNPLKGYNKTEGGSNGKASEETKRKLSESKKGPRNHLFGKPAHNKGMSNEERYGIEKAEEIKILSSFVRKGKIPPNRKKVSAFCPKNKDELIFESAHHAADYFKTSFQNISRYCLGTRKPLKGWSFKYINQTNQEINEIEAA